MKELKTTFIIILFIVITSSIIINTAYATPVPDVKCETGNMVDDYACMKANWRPKKQVSYDTAKTYCTRGGGQLSGQGEIMLWVDNVAYNFKIDCK
jgi:hypothetical protein